MDPVIVFPVYNRPDYFRAALRSWSRARGIDRATLVISCEPGFPEIGRLARSATFGRGDPLVISNATRLGVEENPRQAIRVGFEFGDFVIAAEEDDLVSTDVLEYFSWCESGYRDDPSVFAVCAFTLGGYPQPEIVYRDGEFRPTVCGFWRDRWQEIEDSGLWGNETIGWDNAVQTLHLQGRCVLKPGQSKAQHIGRIGSKSLMREAAGIGHIESANFVAEVPPQEYREA
jgi:hypothetical protein